MLDELLMSLRKEVEEAVFPCGAFVRLDRGKALLVTDASRRGGGVSQALSETFDIAEENGLTRLTPRLAFVPVRLRGAVFAMLKEDSRAREKRIRQTLAICLREKREEETAFMKRLFKEEIA